MSKAGRIFQLAQEIAASYDLLNARRAGSGDSYTREVVDHLKSVVVGELGPGVVSQFLTKANRQSVDFWIEDEQTILEIEHSMWSSDSLLEKEVFKALLAKDASKNVRHLILIGDPGLIRRWQTPTARSVMDWVERHHEIRVQLWELREMGTLFGSRNAERRGDLLDEN
ncbi:MAG: hypothetical protein JXQ71_01480 [Verrucomicrobia bacterium]|nr:hypothetical protein [Verrucomicrobiota bacterium]